MLSGLTQAARTIALGAAGITVLGASANVVAILAGAVQRLVVQAGSMAYAAATGAENKLEVIAKANQKKPEPSAVCSYIDKVTPFKGHSFQDLAISGLTNLVVGTAAIYVAHRFCPSLVTSANSLLHNVVAIQFTPHHIPLTRLAGL